MDLLQLLAIVLKQQLLVKTDLDCDFRKSRLHIEFQMQAFGFMAGLLLLIHGLDV